MSEPSPTDATRKSLLWRLGQMTCRLVTTACFDLKVYGTRHIPPTGGALIVSNHQSYLDPVVLAVHLRRPMSFMARATLFKGKFFGWLISNLNAIPVRQGEGDVGAVKETIRRLQEGHVLNIFPEGSRTESGAIGPMLAGAALVIRRAGVPVVPAVIYGSFEAWPKGRKLFQTHPIRVLYGPPLAVEGLKAAAITELIDRTLRRMFDELRARETGS
jgi:1-acyl-sn-glycerol-3-phosphate acyltransferase